ncbi:superfamily II DNA or RNA helicase [Modicisalibacter xianhensis]|uniref:Superfamily II DNA or RNA helicase n=1 Tax=Modicisalibacter xianhensis TaxID=442341 RepID=A0A4R8FZG7_9GAMM|nr:DEAD/DEAH box helicase family protein [Halomonas xianhensis]TDX32140.1 superfamily II DNA or RNA helicase [Halomonas xianhensis]
MSALNSKPTSLTGEQPPLRSWQVRCIQQALKTLSPTTPHFLCQATPGAGKMRMAAVLADELMGRGDIDTVIYLGPTTAVVECAAETLSDVTGQPMDGRLGAAGATYTYHALHYRLDELKRLCEQARVLLSHHAAGRNDGMDGLIGANRWGLALLALERHVRYTLALSGTPWRTDGSCLPLLRYMTATPDAPGPDNSFTRVNDEQTEPAKYQLIPDFIYSLSEAIQESICRLPRLHLVDNRDIQLTAYHQLSGRTETHRYSSIPHLLCHPAMHYSNLLRHSAPMAHLLDLGCQQLFTLRQHDPDAAGLVVASDIAHAETLAEQLEDRGQSVCLVTSKSPGAHARLRAFREDTMPWIVAVGMVSEGVDIPRLRVCCYLSHVRTEQAFRQVLGRIIRREGAGDPECYLFALNEPTLRHFARRITDDLPEELAMVSLAGATSAGLADLASSTTSPAPPAPAHLTLSSSVPDTPSTDDPTAKGNDQAARLTLGALASPGDTIAPDVEFSQRFIARLIALQLPSPGQP